MKTPGSQQDHRKAAFEEVQRACEKLGARLFQIPFQKLEFGVADAADQFYSADAAIVDLSVSDQQVALFFHLGTRESFNMKHNILIYNDTAPDATRQLRLSSSSQSQNALVTYRYNSDSRQCQVTEALPSLGPDDSLASRLRKMLQEVEVQTK